MLTLEREIFSYFENMKNYIRARPIIFAGVAGSGGGIGGPPGGLVGQLPQTGICFDLSEDAIWPIPASGTSLLDNLNRIRYRLQTLESGGGGPGTITIQKDGIVVASGITNLNIVGDLNVTASGDVATVEHSKGCIDNLTGFIVNTSGFTTTKTFIPGTLKVYYNGLRQLPTRITEHPSGIGFTTTFVVLANSEIVCDYNYYESSQPSGGGWGINWGASWGSP